MQEFGKALPSSYGSGGGKRMGKPTTEEISEALEKDLKEE